MIGIFSFSHAHGGGGGCAMSQSAPVKEQHHHIHSHGSIHHGHSNSLTDNANMKGVFLHVLADTLGSVSSFYSIQNRNLEFLNF